MSVDWIHGILRWGMQRWPSDPCLHSWTLTLTAVQPCTWTPRSGYGAQRVNTHLADIIMIAVFFLRWNSKHHRENSIQLTALPILINIIILTILWWLLGPKKVWWDITMLFWWIPDETSWRQSKYQFLPWLPAKIIFAQLKGTRVDEIFYSAHNPKRKMSIKPRSLWYNVIA